MTPKISIVIPVYNGERYIRRAIEGVLAQTFTDWELILVDDGSRDASGVICDEYAGERIHVVHQKNGGVSAARNAGIELAQGEYIAFVDADDIIGKDYLANLAQGFGSDLIITGFCYDYRPHTPLIGGVRQDLSQSRFRHNWRNFSTRTTSASHGRGSSAEASSRSTSCASTRGLGLVKTTCGTGSTSATCGRSSSTHIPATTSFPTTAIRTTSRLKRWIVLTDDSTN